MKALILAGGLGSRLSEETSKIPKPMIQIGSKPIIWHIMKFYQSFDINEFIILGGYKCNIIKNFFYNKKTVLKKNGFYFNIDEKWSVKVLNTGIKTQTGGRLLKARKFIKKDKYFFFTYGDGLTNLDLNKQLKLHLKKKKLCTMTCVNPEARFGEAKIKKNLIINKFVEKNKNKNVWINGGYFVASPKVLNYIKNSSTIWERDPMEKLAKESNLIAFKHKSFWKPMDTMKDLIELKNIWKNKKLWRIKR